MGKYVIAAIAATVLVAPAAASEDAACGNAPRSQWMSQDAAKAKAVEMGYQVRRVKVEDGCYEIYAIDKNGNRVEAMMDPVTARIVRNEMDD